MTTTFAPAGRTDTVGDFVAWDGGALFIGNHGTTVPQHAHYAIQVAFCGTPGIRFRAGPDEPWHGYAAAAIPSRQPHEMDVTDLDDWVVLFVEPETREGRALTERWLRAGIAEIPEPVLAPLRGPLLTAWRERRDADAVRAAARAVITTIAGGVEPTVTSDERILRAVAYVNGHLDASPTLEQVAAEACLSPSRFRHLFVEQTGMALRPYILWRRLLRVWDLLMAGASFSAAAHAAGFADAAHLTRTSRRMFGSPPSAMMMAGLLRR